MKRHFLLALVALTAVSCGRGDKAANSQNSAAPAANGQNSDAAPAPTAAAATPAEPVLGLCHMGRCSVFRFDKQETVRQAGGERLLRLAAMEGIHYPAEGAEFPENARGLAVEWDDQPTEIYALCSQARPSVITRKEGGDGWDAVQLDLIDGINFAVHDLAAHYVAACHPGEKLDDGFGARAGYRGNGGGEGYDLARPEDIFSRRAG